MCVPYSKLSAGVDLVSVVVPRVVEVVANTKRVIYLLFIGYSFANTKIIIYLLSIGYSFALWSRLWQTL